MNEMRQPVDVDDFERWFDDREQAVTRSLVDYLAIPTVTPDEHLAHDFLREYLAEVGAEVTLLPTSPELAGHWSRSPHPSSRMDEPGRAQVRAQLVTAPGDAAATTLFNAHVDVVPPTPEIPWAFTPKVEDGVVWGRGACDTKNNLVMLVEAVRYLREAGLTPTRSALLDVAIEEEIGGNGSLSSLLQLPAGVTDVVCLEPTSLRVFRGHRGCLSFSVVVAGRSVHMGSGEVGVDAIRGAIDVIAELRELERTMQAEAREHPAFAGWPSPLQLNVGVIRGGEWSGSIPERCTLWADLGFLPTTSMPDLEKRIEAAARQVAPAAVAEDLVLDFAAGLRNDAYLTPADAPIVGAVEAAAAAAGRRAPGPVEAWNVSCDARLYAQVAGLPTVVFGSGDLADAHSPHERVSLRQVREGACALATYLTTAVEG